MALVASMLHDPEVLFLDEPTSGVTPAARARFWDLIKRVAEKKKTVFVTTHYMDEAEQCQRIALMRTGQLVALDSPLHLKEKYFPQGLLEFELKKSIEPQKLSEFMKSSTFSLFEPYGMRYHVEIQNPVSWQNMQNEVQEYFSIHPIRPSLEDVFIRVVEGKRA